MNWSHWAWPLATGCLGAVFTGLVAWQWRRRRRSHQAAWTVGMLIYTIAAVMEAWSEYSGAWNPTVYRLYIVFAASLVGFLGLGTLYLLTRRRVWGHIYLVFVLVCMGVFFYGTFRASLITSKLVPGITVGGQALGESLTFPRVMSLPLNVTGSLFLFGGALYSIWRFIRRTRVRLPGVGQCADRRRRRPARLCRVAGQARQHGRSLPGGDGRCRAHAGRFPGGGNSRERQTRRSGSTDGVPKPGGSGLAVPKPGGSGPGGST